MRRAFLATPILALLCACGSSNPPPGELIGSFRFAATLEGTTDEGRCRFSGAPSELAFQGVLSYERDTGKLWLSTDESSREGNIVGTAFVTRTPAEGEGIARRLSTCTCQMRMVEEIAGEILAAKDCGEAAGPAPVVPEQTCPELVDGRESWNCGCVRGTIREEVVFPAAAPAAADGAAACTCLEGGLQQPAPDRCEFLYRLEGTLT